MDNTSDLEKRIQGSLIMQLEAAMGIRNIPADLVSVHVMDQVVLFEFNDTSLFNSMNVAMAMSRLGIGVISASSGKHFVALHVDADPKDLLASLESKVFTQGFRTEMQGLSQKRGRAG